MKISPRFTVDNWKNLAFTAEEDWLKAIEIVTDRIDGRWLRWIDEIVSSRFSGFAVLALDCIVLESLWGFMHGRSVPRRGEQQAYRDILTGPRFRWTDTQCDNFREFVRNGLIHDAETRNRWIIEKSIPRTAMIERNSQGDYLINRTKFHQALKASVEDWIKDLRFGNNIALRQKMRKRMDQMISRHYA